MNRSKLISMLLSICLVLAVGCDASEDLSVLSGKVNGIDANDMMRSYLWAQVEHQYEKWQEQYELREEPNQIAEYQKNLRAKFIDAIGGFPERTPLNPQVTGIVQRDGYRVEKIIFESEPNFFVTGLLFFPDPNRFAPPYPAVLEPCGHSLNGKGRDFYQGTAALQALNGIACFVVDPIDQGERGQLPSEWPDLWGVNAHTNFGISSIPLGRNPARVMIWDNMRAIDYLQTRADIDPQRIGCAGLSGGGTNTAYMQALDDRVKAAAPAGYITNFDRLLGGKIGPQDAEQNIFGQLAFGLDHADFLMMRAPIPTLIVASTTDFFDIVGTWVSFRYAKRLYSRMGFAERIDLIEHDGKHWYHKPQREATIRWMMRWLRGVDEPITEPEIKELTAEEYQCTPTGQVMDLPGFRSVYDLNQDYENQLKIKRKKLWSQPDKSQLLDKVREIAGVRKLDELGEPKVQKLGTIKRKGYSIQKIIFTPEEGIALPGLFFSAEKCSCGKCSTSKKPILYLHQDGKNAAVKAIEKFVRSGRTVLAVDVRDNGETTTKPTNNNYDEVYGPGGQQMYMAYMLGRSYVGMRTEDILTCARWLSETQSSPVDMIAVGNVGVSALHAAVLESDLFGQISIKKSLASWSNIVENRLSKRQLVNVVHGALEVYDLDDMANYLKDKLTITESLDAMGEPITAK